MHQASAFSTTATTNSTTGASTKGFLSFSSRSVIDSSKGPSLKERVKANCLHLATNMHRYKGFSPNWITFSAIFRVIQNYAVFLMPGCTSFWNRNESTSFFVRILTIIIHFCVVPQNLDFHCYFCMVLVIPFLIATILLFRLTLKNPNDYSLSNGLIFTLSLFFNVLVRIGGVWTFSITGNLFRQVIMGKDDAVLILSFVIGLIGCVNMTLLHYVGFFLVRGSSSVDFNALFHTWAPYNQLYAHSEMYFSILAFLEEALDLNDKWNCIGFSIACMLIANPGTMVCVLIFPIFQDVNDSAHYATQLMVGMFLAIIMDLHLVSETLTPALVFVIVIIIFVVFMLICKMIVRRRIQRHVKALYSVYKQSNPVLPPTTPLVFTSPGGNQVALSHEAYMVTQAFASLEIDTATSFRYYLAVGALVRMPAIRNIDFIKWGLNQFSDNTTLIICAQICQHFEDTGQTQTVLIQRLHEISNMSLFISFTLHNLEMDHADVISDKPIFLKVQQRKATASLARCRRALSVFWGCVLKHSAQSMKEALCRLRDCVKEADVHFEELMRCYPVSLEAIALNLSFLTEVKGQYLECNRYINDMSTMFIEMKSDAFDDDESIDGISVLLQDQSRTYSPYINKLSQYMEQERQACANSRGPIAALWVLAVVSIIVVVGCILFVIVETLVSFQKYPTLLKIINSCDDVIIELSSMILGARRLCLFSAAGLTEPPAELGMDNSDSTVYDVPDALIEHMLARAETLPIMLERFFRNTSTNTKLLHTLNNNQRELKIFGLRVNETLAFSFDMMSSALRSIATNIPKRFFHTEMMQEEDNSAKLLEREDFKAFMIRKGKQQLLEGPLSGDIVKWKMMDKQTFNERREAKIRETAVSKSVDEPLGDKIEDFQAVCNSSEMLMLAQNIEVTAALCDDFVTTFIEVSKEAVDGFEVLIWYSMILLPIIYIVTFLFALMLVSLYLRKEIEFQLTLFLSLPEQVASEIYKNGGVGNFSERKADLLSDNVSANSGKSAPRSVPNSTGVELISPEVEMMKEKALTIEGLYQFSTNGSTIKGTGLKHYIIWCIIYIFIAALAVFSLTYYARDVNSTFHARSLVLCNSALRFSMSEYASMFIQEGFLHDQFAIFEPSELIRLSEYFWQRAYNLHFVLTYGSDDIPFDFRSSDEMESIVFLKVPESPPADFDKVRSASLIHHDGYRYFGFHSDMNVFLESTRAIIDLYKLDEAKFQLNDDTWHQYSHLVLGHLAKNLGNATLFHLNEVSTVIDSSFIVALVISIFTLVVLVLLVVGPIGQAALALQRYINIVLHVLCQVPPDVFRRSLYISKWLKGHISRRNYNQYESTFKRTVPPQIQSRVIDESPEQLMLFNSSGEYMDVSSYDASQIQDKTVKGVLGLAIDVHSNQKIVEDVEKVVQRFIDAKDNVDDVVIMAHSMEGRPLKLTVCGITTSESMTSIQSVQRYYTFTAILIRDVAEEADKEEQYEAQKARTLQLMGQLVPGNFAVRMHDGERRFTFNSGIGSVLVFEIIDFDDHLVKMGMEAAPKFTLSIRKQIDSILAEIENLSLISLRNGKAMFVAGLFNDEQNGRTEALDTIQFTVKLNQAIKQLSQEYDVDLAVRYAICTGGPIYCKLLMDISPVSLVSGEPITMSHMLLQLCNPGQLLLERTTYECIYGLSIEMEQAGEFEYTGRHNSYYSIAINSIEEVNTSI